MFTMNHCSTPPPKALLFDIGGVCVVSPMRAILDYELAHSIPPGWVNFSISRTAPNGSWHRLERGEMKMDKDFFAAFNADLRRPELWLEHCAKAAAKARKDEAGMVNAVGDATSTAIQGSTISAHAEMSELPPLPDIDAEWMFWEMMRASRQPDPYMFPALKKLKASKKFLMGALSNTYIFPDGHPYNEKPENLEEDVKGMFDLFVSSAHVGMRKPDPKIYDLAMGWLEKAWRTDWDGKDGRDAALGPGDVVFLDDIGANLKGARRLGMRTLKVTLGQTRHAVRELEKITGMSLLEETPKL